MLHIDIVQRKWKVLGTGREIIDGKRYAGLFRELRPHMHKIYYVKKKHVEFKDYKRYKRKKN